MRQYVVFVSKSQRHVLQGKNVVVTYVKYGKHDMDETEEDYQRMFVAVQVSRPLRLFASAVYVYFEACVAPTIQNRMHHSSWHIQATLFKDNVSLAKLSNQLTMYVPVVFQSLARLIYALANDLPPCLGCCSSVI
jgi:hypothetical protein